MISLFVVSVVLTVFLSFWLIGMKANKIDWEHALVNCLDGWVRILCHRYHGLNGHELDLADNGKAILAANHVSGLDPLLLIAAVKRPLRFLIAREEYERFGLHWLFKAAKCIPVDRGGRADRAFKSAIKELEKGEVVAIFPHGKIHLDHQSPKKIKKGIIRLGQLSQCDISMFRITGVKGEGKTLLAIFQKSKVRITRLPTISKEHFQDADLEQNLGELLLGWEGIKKPLSGA